MPSIAAATPVSELKLRTNFILNRKAFLDDVCEAIHNEDIPQYAEMLKLLIVNDYIPVIARLMTDTDADLSDQATWTMANLLGSDSREVRSAANAACLPFTEEIFANLCSDKKLRSTAYLLFNWTRRFTKNDDVDERVLKLLDDNFISTVKKATIRVDLLHSINASLTRTHAGHKASHNLLGLFKNAGKKEFSLLLDCIGEICSEDGTAFAEADISLALDTFETLLIRSPFEITDTDRTNILHALSNFVTEPTVADKFFTRCYLRNEVTLLCEDVCVSSRKEATWVLCNAISRSEWESTQMDLAEDHRLLYAFNVAMQDLEESPLLTAIHEALDTLNEFMVLYTPIEEEEDESDAETELVAEEYIPLPSLNKETNPPPSLAQVESPLPSALELLVDTKNVNGGAALRGLIATLKNTGATAWVPVAPGTTFTIEDLTLMGSLGYTISNGYFGINPYMTALRYF